MRLSPLGLVAALVLGGCGADAKKPAAVPGTDRLTHGASQADQSRCEYAGRADREVTETAGPGAIQPNIRRVYAILGVGEERRRVLVCREVDTNLDGIKDVVRTYNDKGEAATEFSDTNFSGRIDTWITFSNGRRSKVEVDRNGDGRANETRYYIRGKLSRVQRDTNGDGKPDVWEIYDEGKLQRIGLDVDLDGRVDRWNRDEVAVREEAEAERKREEAERKAAQQQAQ
jgi:hypothetical protein